MILSNQGVCGSRKASLNFAVSWLNFVRQGLVLSDRNGWWKIFFESWDRKNEHFEG